jgi:organic radical activating enzyme
MKTLCTVPSTIAFTNNRGGFRNCCSASPQLHSQQEDFAQWWSGDTMTKFRQQLVQSELPPDCGGCALQEKTQGSSFRTSVDQTISDAAWPSTWNIIFGNTCNLACWTCNENNSSVIEQHKRQIKVLSDTFISPNKQFDLVWPDIQAGIMKSYQHHDTVTLTLLGGEPLYNTQVLEFLASLELQGLAPRTKLEFHTNATTTESLPAGNWQYVCAFLSIDAVGTKAEWLRYGTKWPRVEQNVQRLKQQANYTEVHCTLSVLNLKDLPALKQFCEQHNLPLKVHAMHNPAFMAIKSWDGSKESLCNSEELAQAGFGGYYTLLGSVPVAGHGQLLKQYIQQFDSVRKPLRDFDPQLASVLL